MRINLGFEKDPLRKAKHRVLAKVDGGYQILDTVDDPIELLKLEIEGQHAVGMPNADIVIVDEGNTVVANYGSYHVEPQDGPPTEERKKVRDRWLEAVMRFLLPPGLYAVKDDPKKADRIARWFRGKKIQIEMRPDGGAVRIWRDGALLSSWGC